MIVETKHADTVVISQSVPKEEKPKEKVHLFGKMFKKKAEPPAKVESVHIPETPKEDQTDVGLPAADPQLVSMFILKGDVTVY